MPEADMLTQKPDTNQLSPALSSQDPLPNLIPFSAQDWEKIHQDPMTRVLYGKLNLIAQIADHGPSLTILTKLAGCWEERGDLPVNSGTVRRTLQQNFQRLCLYKLNMLADGSLRATIQVRKRHDIAGVRSGFYVAYREPGQRSLEYTYHAMRPPTYSLGPFVYLPIRNPNKDLVELGVFVEGDPDQPQAIALLEISNIAIKPCKETEDKDLETAFTIEDVHLVEVVKESRVDKRITWRWATTQGRVWPVGMPWSQTTGPFSSFAVHVGGSKVVVEAFSTQCSLKPEEIEDLDERVVVQVVGKLFGGGHIHSALFFARRAYFVNNASGHQ
ncbi:MAG: hypothetical protein Q9221_004887 [Calogaya cf. arnoldii]